MQDLGTLGGTDSFGEAINAAGHVTGSAQITGDGAEHAFLWGGGAMQDLGSIELRSFGLDINDSGQVVGISYEEPNQIISMHAFLWDGAAMRDLGTLGGTRTAAARINSSGQVVGAGRTSSSSESSRAFVWIDGTLYDLNDLIDPSDPLKPYVTLTGADDINDRGQILAQRLRQPHDRTARIHRDAGSNGSPPGHGGADGRQRQWHGGRGGARGRCARVGAGGVGPAGVGQQGLRQGRGHRRIDFRDVGSRCQLAGASISR